MRIIRLIDFSSNTKLHAVNYMRLERKRDWLGYSLSRKRDYNAFFYIHKGSVEFKNKAGEVTACEENNIMFMPKGYSCASVYSAEITDLSVANFRLEEDGEEATFSDCLEVMPPEYATRYRRFFLAFEDIQKNTNPTLHYTRSLCTLLAEMNTGNFIKNDDSQFALIAIGVEMLIDRFKDNIPISEIARRSMISESYFRRIFKHYYGKSPIEFRNQLRVNFANDLYATGLYTKAEAARSAGIENANYFSRLKAKYDTETENRK